MADESLPLSIISRKEAKALGLKKFFTGVPCKKGHVVERATQCGTCITCRDDRVRAWNEKHKDRRFAIRQKWRTENKGLERASQRAWTERNIETVIAYRKTYYRKNKDRHAALTARWKSDNPLLQIIYSQNGRARRLGIIVGTGVQIDHYHQMLVDQCGHCAYCGQPAIDLVMDHVLAIARDGLHGPSNCVLACAPCNRIKDIDRLDVFLEYLAKKRPNIWTASPADIEHLLAAPWRRE